MNLGLKAIETTGTLDDQRQLTLDESVPVACPTRVRVLLLLGDETEIDEAEWMRAATRGQAFDFLADPAEDVYSLQDGSPFHG